MNSHFNGYSWNIRSIAQQTEENTLVKVWDYKGDVTGNEARIKGEAYSEYEVK
jgi:hypothetical protein